MPIGIHNNDQLTLYFRNGMEKVIDAVSEEVLSALQTFIEINVYDAAQRDFEREWYYKGTKEPTMQFLNAFHWDDMKETSREITRILFYDWATMDVGTVGKDGDYLHTQNGDFRQDMAESFNVDGFVMGDFNKRKREPYWDNFINTMFGGDKQLDNLFKIYISKYI